VLSAILQQNTMHTVGRGLLLWISFGYGHCMRLICMAHGTHTHPSNICSHTHTYTHTRAYTHRQTCTLSHTHTSKMCTLLDSAGLLKEIEARGQRNEYQRLLAECQSLYSQARLQLVSPLIAQRLALDQVRQDCLCQRVHATLALASAH